MNVLRVFIAIFILLISFSSQAGNNDKCEVRPVSGFEFTMSIHKYKPNNKYILKIEVDDDYWNHLDIDDVLLWSNSIIKDNDLSAAIFYDDSLLQNKNYELGFKYIKTSSSHDVVHGELTYYRKLEGGTWKQIDSKPLSLSRDDRDKSDVELDVKGKNRDRDRTNLNCQGTIPDIIDPTPPAPISNNFCEYFPEPAQSWITKGTTDYSSYPDSSLNMTNAKSPDSYIRGWSDRYIQDNRIEIFDDSWSQNNITVLKTGFDTTTDFYNLHAPTACDVSGCEVGHSDVNNRKISAPPIVNGDFSSTDNLDLTSGKYSSICSDSSSLCRYTDSTRMVVILADLNSLRIDNYSSKNITVEFSGNRMIKSYYVAGLIKTNFPDVTTQTFNTVKFNDGKMSINFGKHSIINVVSSWEFNGPVDIEAQGNSDTFLYGPQATFLFNTPNVPFNAYILGKNVSFETPITINGGVTANQLTMKQNVKIIDQGICKNPVPSKNYSLDVTPDNQFSLLCQTPEVTYTVYSEDGTIATDYPGTITATYPSGLTPLDPTAGSKTSNYVYTPNDGVVTVPVKSDTLAEYTIKAELTDFPKKNDSGLLNFVPFAFGIEEQKVIANKPKFVTVTALACNNNNKEVVIDYSGKPTVTSNLSEPIGGVGELDFAPTLSKGLSTSDLSFSDSGKLTVKLEDDNFDCTGLKDCPIGDDGEADGKLQGSFDVYSRPWTFAICPEVEVDATKMNGNITDAFSAAFTSSGTDFNLKIKPLRWVNGAADSDPISGLDEVDVTNYCDQDPTQNFVSNLSPKATMQLTHNVAEPDPSIANKGSLGGVTNQLSTEPNNSYFYSFADISWSEVGVLKIQADLMANYYDMHVNLGYRNIGRFYPHHLSQIENTWTYAAGHNGFAYMNQPTQASFTIEAQNASNQPTKNYSLFDESLQNKIGLVAVQVDNMGNETIDLTSRLNCSPGTPDLANRLDCTTNTDTGIYADFHWSGAELVINDDNFKFLKKDVTDGSPYITVPDGPYTGSNAKFGAYVSDMKDGVGFDYDSGTEIGRDSNVGVNHGLAFNTQPDFRYGRMTLDSVSGPIGGPINVPLRVEYWDGSSFITNTDDSGSEFKTRVYYVMSNLQDSSAKFSDVGTSKVTNGKSSVLKAEQANSQRETVRLFLRQGNDSTGYENSPKPADDPDLKETIKGWNEPVEDIGQPWLQFNWRNLGDEDPSTVVIFGAYRGNDRIIYRGEPNLTAN